MISLKIKDITLISKSDVDIILTKAILYLGNLTKARSILEQARHRNPKKDELW